MCGIIGVDCKNTKQNLELIKNLFLQSKIRGLHATGMSYIKRDNLHTVKESCSANKFVEKYNMSHIFEGEEFIKLVGHCRYSTSDIRFHQPIADEDISIVHNGIVTQELYEKWFNKFNLNCETGNDSELIFRYFKEGCSITNIQDYFKGISFAILVLEKQGNLISYRNSLRPLWLVKRDVDKFYASTKNILIRSGFKDNEILKLDSIDYEEKQNRYM